MARKRGISDTKLALINLLQKERFRAVPAAERVLFLPHCLRKPKGCRGETTEEGLICKHCSPDCAVNQLTSYATSKGYRCFVVPGGEMVFNLVEKHRPRAILGVACHHEMGQAAERIGSKESTVSFAYQGVPLSKTGCVDTRVDMAAVKAVIDMEPDPTPVMVERAPAPAHSRRIPWRIGAFAAATVAVLLAAFLFIPPMLAPISAPAKTGQPELSFSNPTAVNTVDGNGRPMVEVTVAVRNFGPGEVRGVRINATAYYCGGKFNPADGGGAQGVVINRPIAAGGLEDVTLRVRVHSYNDTSILIEKTVRGMTEVVGYIESRKSVFIIDADVIGYSTSLVSGRQANLTFSVFNSEKIRTAGSLRIDASSYTSINTHYSSVEQDLPGSLARNDTWTQNLLVGVSVSDPGQPTFVLELYEGSASSPTDTVTISG